MDYETLAREAEEQLADYLAEPDDNDEIISISSDSSTGSSVVLLGMTIPWSDDEEQPSRREFPYARDISDEDSDYEPGSESGMDTATDSDFF